jgi:hypothetical protein
MRVERNGSKARAPRRVCAETPPGTRLGVAVKHKPRGAGARGAVSLNPLPGEYRDKDGAGLGQQHVSGRLEGLASHAQPYEAGR